MTSLLIDRSEAIIPLSSDQDIHRKLRLYARHGDISQRT
jgi:hypothetical protein